MKRALNHPTWIGFGIVLIAILSYIPVFVNFASTRDVPWVNYSLFAVGLAMLAVGLRRAYAIPQNYRGKASGTLLGVLGVLLAGFFVVGTVYFTKQIPPAANALHVGQQAPTFALQNADGKPVALSELEGKHRGVVLIFYRGYW